jgi:hypothetical protein
MDPTATSDDENRKVDPVNELLAPSEDVSSPLPEAGINTGPTISTEDGPPILNLPDENPLNPKTMEVHKHPHGITHKKKWGEYFLEFTMIFFAVFLGFVAENIRETIVIKEKAKTDAHTLVSDLKKDTTEYAEAVFIKNKNVAGIDTLIHLLRRPDYQNLVREITSRFVYIRNNYYITRNDATSQQMTSSGSLRNFGDPALYNEVTSYYAQIRKYNELNNLQYFRVPVLDEAAGMFDMSLNVDTSMHMHDITDSKYFLQTHKEAMNRFILYASMIQFIYFQQAKEIERLKKQAASLIEAVNKQYRFNE